MRIAALLLGAFLSLRAGAAISEGPVLTNAAAAEERRLSQFYRAEQSFQEKLKVGQERYNQKQAERAKIIAGMSSQLQARQQVVVIQPVPSSAATAAAASASGSGPWQALAALGTGLIVFGYYWSRRNAED